MVLKELRMPTKPFGTISGSLRLCIKTHRWYIEHVLAQKDMLIRILIWCLLPRYQTMICWLVVFLVKTILWLLRWAVLVVLKVRKGCFGGRYIVF